MDDDGYAQFYAEIGTPESVKNAYAPPGKCRECGAKLSIYRAKAYGEFDRWCWSCQRRGDLMMQCENCWEMFPSQGTRTVCAKCIVPSVRKKRKELARDRVKHAYELYQQKTSFFKISSVLYYNSEREAKFAIERYQDECLSC